VTIARSGSKRVQFPGNTEQQPIARKLAMFIKSDKSILRRNPLANDEPAASLSKFNREQGQPGSRSKGQISQYLTTETPLNRDSSFDPSRFGAFSNYIGSGRTIDTQMPIKSVIKGYLGTKKSTPVGYNVSRDRVQPWYCQST
jgi:hypothetical protein